MRLRRHGPNTTDSTCYWIYLERTVDSRWFLHGLYA